MPTPRRAPLVLALLLAASPAAAAQSAPAPGDAPSERRTRTIRLWDPAGPACIRLRPGDALRPERLPPPYASPPIADLFGPGVDERDLAAGWGRGSARPPTHGVSAGGAQFLVVYTDPSGTGFWDPTLGPARRAAFELAASRTMDLIDDGNIVISIDASMPAMGTDGGPLASGAPTQGHMDSDWPLPDAWYGEPLASHLDDADPDTGMLDIAIQFNASWDASTTPWYYGSGTAPATEYHFVNTALHELTHGLDFLSTFTSSGGLSNEDPFAFDVFLETTGGSSLIGLPDVPSTVTGDDVVWDGTASTLCWQHHMGGGGEPRIFAPTPWDGDSSLSHFDEALFTGAWELMSPSGSVGEAPGGHDAVTRGLLEDLGWDVIFEGVYVTASASGPQTGKPHQPFGSLSAGLSAAANEGKGEVWLTAGTHDVSGLLIDQPVLLRGWPGPSVIQ